MVLCLLGFRGAGYSSAFVQTMAAVQIELFGRPHRTVQLLDRPDPICEACPNLVDGGCTLGGPEHEVHMRLHDREVLHRLGLEPGAVLTWAEIRERIGSRIRGADLPAICTTCPWLPMGVCAESVDALRAETPDPEGPNEA